MVFLFQIILKENVSYKSCRKLFRAIRVSLIKWFGEKIYSIKSNDGGTDDDI